MGRCPWAFLLRLCKWQVVRLHTFRHSFNRNRFANLFPCRQAVRARPTGLIFLERVFPIGALPAPKDWLCYWLVTSQGAVAQLGERLICIQEVVGSNPISSTRKASSTGVNLLARALKGATPFHSGFHFG